MIELQREGIDQAQWTATVSKFKDISLLQTWEYGEASRATGEWGVERILFRDGEQIVGATQALTRLIPWVGGGLVWVNRGPLWQSSDNGNQTILPEIMEVMRAHWVDRRGLYLRVAPPLNQDQMGSQPPVPGFRPSGEGRGWSSARLDLTRPIERIREGLDKKWRNSLSNAERANCTLASDAESSFDQTLRQFRELLSQNQFSTTLTEEFLRCLETSAGGGTEFHVLSAEKNGQFAGGIIVVRYCEIAEYLVGAINEVGRTANAGQFLLWQAICRMKSAGCTKFDLGGLHPEMTPSGVLQFKSGLNAEPYEYVGEFEAWKAGLINSVVRWRVRHIRKKFP